MSNCNAGVQNFQKYERRNHRIKVGKDLQDHLVQQSTYHQYYNNKEMLSRFFLLYEVKIL